MWWPIRPRARATQDNQLTKRSGFLARLGNLIVLQSLFVFVAIGLLLFYSNDNISDGGTTDHTRAVIQELGRRLAGQFTEGQEPSATEPYRTELQVGSEGIVSAALFTVRGDGSVSCLKTLGSQPLTLYQSVPEGESRLSAELIRHVASEPPGFILSSICSADQTIFYYRPDVPGGMSAVFTALVNHDLLISRRSSMQHTLLLLFLCSILLSLMTVYLIWKRFRQPLVRMIRRLEKTAEGEVYYQLETEGDIELNVLSGTFNRIAKTLWNNQQEMKGYNSRLRDINTSLLQSRMFLATLIDSSPSSIVVTARDGKVIIFNREASKTFGYDADNAIGKDINELFKHPLATELSERSAESPGFEAIGLRADGTAFPVYLVATPIHSEEHDIWAFVYIIHDISESKSFQDMMIRLDRYSTRGEMAGDIAHEINNYLAVLAGNLELFPIILKKGDPDKIAAKLALMRSTVDRITRFADGLMDTNPDDLTLEMTNINQVIENVVAFLKPQNKFDTVEFCTDLSSGLPPIRIDLGQIQQLLVNLINNAADALSLARESSKQSIHIATAVGSDEKGQYASITVKDSGPGVPEDKVETLFSKRFTTKRKGHGIGLITCKRIVDAHQGTIHYSYDGGATFTCTLPYQRIEAAQAAETTSAAPDAPVLA